MDVKKTAVLLSRKLTLYTVNLAPPGRKFKFDTYFWPFPASRGTRRFMLLKPESNSACFEVKSTSVLDQGTICKLGGAN